MQLPRLRFTILRMMVAVFILSVLMATMVHWVRYRRLKTMVVNQEITLSSAEVNVLNAALAYDNAARAVTEYAEKIGLKTSSGGDTADPTLDSLKSQVERTQTRRRYFKAVWKHERLLLKRLNGELKRMWSFWPIRGAIGQGTSEPTSELSDQEAAEIDLRLRYMGQSAID